MTRTFPKTVQSSGKRSARTRTRTTGTRRRQRGRPLRNFAWTSTWCGAPTARSCASRAGRARGKTWPTSATRLCGKRWSSRTTRSVGSTRAAARRERRSATGFADRIRPACDSVPAGARGPQLRGRRAQRPAPAVLRQLDQPERLGRGRHYPRGPQPADSLRDSRAHARSPRHGVGVRSPRLLSLLRDAGDRRVARYDRDDPPRGTTRRRAAISEPGART